MTSQFHQRQDQSATVAHWADTGANEKPSAADRLFIIIGLGVMSWAMIGALAFTLAPLLPH